MAPAISLSILRYGCRQSTGTRWISHTHQLASNSYRNWPLVVTKSKPSEPSQATVDSGTL